MENETCIITGRNLSKGKKWRGCHSRNIFFIYKDNGFDVDKTKKEVSEKLTYVNEYDEFYSCWRAASRSLGVKYNVEEPEKIFIYEKYFKPWSRCRLERCDEKIPYEFLKYKSCCVLHYNQTLKNRVLKDPKYLCLEDGNKFTRLNRLTRHLKDVLNIEPEEYYNKHIKKNQDEGYCKWCKAPTPFKNVRDGYDNFCYNTSCNVLWYNKHQNRAKNCGDKISKTHLIGDRLPSQNGYWMKRGYSEEEAYKKVRETQSTNSVADIMKRKNCSFEEAVQIRAEITDKWLKSFKRMTYSMISQELFVEIWKSVKHKYEKIYFATLKNGQIVDDGKNHEFRVKTFRSSRKIDFYIEDINKCIEFDGTYWHGKKGKGETEELLREDEIIRAIGCEVFHVKERDFNFDRNEVVKECLNFLNK